MKLPLQKRRNQALTLPEVLFVVLVLLFLVAMILPILGRAHIRSGPSCISNLKQVELSFQIWAGDNNNKFPMEVSVTNGGTMGLNNGQNAWINFFVMSNELSTPNVLICPSDTDHPVAGTNFYDIYGKVSYGVFLDADQGYPQQLLSSDDNFASNGVPLNPGLYEVSSSATVTWTAKRHIHVGNIGFADGSVSEVSDQGLQSALALATNGTPTMTNRLAIP
jgi:prepilin-type processing-associated H-X9-DG protein